MGAEQHSHRDKCAIVGIGQTEFSSNSGRSVLTLATEAVKAALDDAGLKISDVDGIVRCDLDKLPHYTLAAALGTKNLSYMGDAGPGGAAPCLMMAQAVGAILSGQAKTVVIYRALNGRSGMRFGAGNRRGGGGDETYDEFYVPYGMLAAGHVFALMANRYALEYGLTPEQLGSIAVTQRAHANASPRAQMHGRTLSMEDYLAARMISTPLRLFDFCLETDGACAFVVTAADVAKDLRKPPVLIRGIAAAAPPDIKPGMMFSTSAREDMTDVPAKWAAQKLWNRAGVGPEDIRCAQVYDCFSIAVLLQLEAFGFCKKGEGGAFVADGSIGRNGRIPVNTGGGHLAEGYIHGVNHILEAVRQVRGEAAMQIPNVDVSLVTSGPIPMGSGAVLRKAA